MKRLWLEIRVYVKMLQVIRATNRWMKVYKKTQEREEF